MPRYRKRTKILWSENNNKVSQGISWTAFFFQYLPNFARKNLRFKSLSDSTGKEDESGKGWAKSRNNMADQPRKKIQQHPGFVKLCKDAISSYHSAPCLFLFVSFHQYTLSFRQPLLWNKPCVFYSVSAKSVPEWMRFLTVLLQYKC